MPTVLQLRRGTTAEHSTFTGAEGEVTVNTTKDTIVVHDGSTQGGFEIALADATNLDLSSVGQSIIPSTDVTYDLGSSSKRWNDIYLAGNTIDLGGSKISKDSNGDIEVKDSSDNPVKIKAKEIELDDSDADSTFKTVLKKVSGKMKFVKVNRSTGAESTDAETVDLSGVDTDDLSEGSTNLYYTDARVKTYLAAVDQDIVPDGDNTRSLGSASYQWQDVFVGPGSLYVNGQQVVSDNSGTITISADANQNVSVQTSGSGDIELDPTGTGIIQVKGALQVQDGNNITNSAGNAITFGNQIAVDSLTSKTADTDLTLSGNGTGNVSVSDGLSVGGALTVTGDLTVNGTTTTINSTTLTVDDKNIVLASGAADSSAADGSGISIDGASATFTYSHTGTKWTMNKALDITGGLTTSGTLTVDSVGISAVQTSAESFVDNDTSIMTSAAAEDRFRVNIYDTAGSLLN